MTTCPGVGTCYDFSLNISFGMLDPFEEPEFEIRDIEVELSVTNAGLTDAFLVERDGTETHFYNDTNGEAQSNYTIDTIGKELKSVVGYIPTPMMMKVILRYHLRDLSQNLEILKII